MCGKFEPPFHPKPREYGEAESDAPGQASLFPADRLLHALMEEMLPDRIYFKDLQSRFVNCNQSFVHWFHLEDFSQMRGRTDFDFFSEIHARKAYEDEQEIIRTGLPKLNIEEKEIWPDGHVTWASTSKAALRDGADRIIGTFGVSREITRHKLAEQAFRESEDLFTSVFQFMPIATAITSLPDHRVLSVNKAFQEIFGYGAEELLGRTTMELGIWANLEDQSLMLDLLGRGQPVQGRDVQIRRKDGSLGWASYSGRLVKLNGETCLLSGSVDITRRKEVEAEQQHLHAQLLKAQKLESLGSLAGGVAHDMNNVLGAILGIASATVETQGRDSPARLAFETIIKAAERGGKMVKGLLRFARQNPADECSLDMNAVIREEVALLERTALSRVRTELDLAGDLRPIHGDPAALGNAVMNLLVNAADSMPQGGTLSLRTWNVDPGWIEVRIEDTGTGMPPEVLDRAMDPFYTTKKQGQGTGLGLSMVYSTVKAHQGRVEILSEPGRGTCVLMHFQINESVTALAEPTADGPSASAGEAKHVLVVDDDELIQASMGALLNALGHRVTTLASGEEALAALGAGLQPDVVILDLNMPGLGGSGTLPLLRALRPALPVLLATGRADQSALDLIASDPRTTLLGKPFTMQDLGAGLRRCIARK